MKITCLIDEKEWTRKPTDWEIVKMQGYTEKETGIYHETTFAVAEIEIAELVQKLTNGATFKPGVLLGGRSAKYWRQQQLFALDFDDGMTPEEALEICERYNIHPVFIYTTFSDSFKKRKFRMVFCTDKVITDGKIRDKLQLTLMYIFGKKDPKCKNRDRLFFGGKGKVPCYSDFEARIESDKIIEKYYCKECELKKTAGRKMITPFTKAKNDNDKEKASVVNKKLDFKYMGNIEAIRNLDVEAMHKLININNKDIIVSNQAKMYEFIKKIDMTEFTGIEIGQKVNCILPDHMEKEASATIYVMDDGTHSYKCFGCNKNILIVTLVEALSGATHKRAIEFLKAVYGIKINISKWVAEQKEIFDYNVDYLNSDDIKTSFPNVYKLIVSRGNRVKHLKLMLQFFKNYISEEIQLNGKPLFYCGYEKLCRACEISPNRRQTMSQTLILFSLLGMIEKIHHTELPEDVLERAKAKAAIYKHKNKYSKMSNFYQFAELGYNQLSKVKAEEKAQDLLENNSLTIGGLSREYIIRTFGMNEANRLFPQHGVKQGDKMNGLSKESHEMFNKITKKILDEIMINGYIKESTIKTSAKMEVQFKKCIQDILNSNNLVRIKASASNKEKYGLPKFLPYQSFVICREI